jgi:hypothetical protein
MPGRPNDVAGAGFGLARISPQARASDRDVIAFSGAPMPIRDFEAVFEVTYQAQITPNWSVQPASTLYIRGRTCPIKTTRAVGRQLRTLPY